MEIFASEKIFHRFPL